MGAIQVKQGFCKNCYACIRACEVKATSIRSGQASIIDDDCLSCGDCLAHCPQKAREIRSDSEIVRNLLKGVTPIWASLAPAAAVGKYSLLEWETMLKRAGFAGVSLTSWGAVPVAAAYNEAALRGGWVLSTACPAAVKLVCRFFPTLTSRLAPVASPMLTHAAWLKATHKAKVVFIGPCAAKKTEAMQSTHIAAALTFAEILPMLSETSTSLDREHVSTSFSSQGLMHFPLPAGLSSSVEVPVLAIDGVSDLWGFLGRVARGETTPQGIVEMSACRGSCLGGPAAFCREITLAERRASLVTVQEGRVHAALPLRTHFIPQPSSRRGPSDTAVADVLYLLGKADPANEYNCGACGYHTCREKAIAVVNGRAELEMCLPYMRTKAESLSHLILASTPNAVILVDRELQIQQWNAAAERLFGIPEAQALHKNIADFLPALDYAALFADAVSIPGKKISVIPGVVTLFTASLVKGGELAMGIYTDITRLEEQGQALLKVRQETIERAQEVINKQMRVAQEIASLLGETTAESKVLLLKLMKVVQGDAK